LSPTNATLSTSKLKTQKRNLNLDRNLRLKVIREGEIYRWKQENKLRFKEKRASVTREVERVTKCGLSFVKKTKNKKQRERKTNLETTRKEGKKLFFYRKKEGKTAEQNLLLGLMRLLLWVVSLLLLL
jgi:hypothetical protein